MKNNNLLIALVLCIGLSSNIFSSEPNQQTSLWQRARNYMASWIPQYIKNKIYSSNIPPKQITPLEQAKIIKELIKIKLVKQAKTAKKLIQIRLKRILDNRKTKGFNVPQEINILINEAFKNAQQSFFNAEAEINNAIANIMKEINPKEKEKFNFFVNIKKFIENKLREKKEA